MNHIPEHTDPTGAVREARKTEIAAAYQECFSSPSGRMVIEDLRRKFGLSRRRFDTRDRNPSAIAAALIEGECNVLRDIEAALVYKA